MNINDLKQQLSVEFDKIEQTLAELSWLSRDTAGRHPSRRETAAAGLFLANFYTGVENTLKRISVFHGVALPSDDNWHIALLKSFCDPPREGLPKLVDDMLERDLAPFRSFRHVVTHGYGLSLHWEDMAPGVENVGQVFARFRAAVLGHLASLESGPS